MSKDGNSAMRWAMVVGAAAVALGWPVSALAQEGARAATETTIHGGTLVMVAYLVLWLMFGAVLMVVLHRQRTLQGELDGLEARIDDVFGSSTAEGGSTTE